MSLAKRVQMIFGGLLTILCAWIMLKMGEEGYYIVALILTGSLIVMALRDLIFYFSMARHMVGGKSVLFRGVILLDLGIFTLSVVNDPKYLTVLYLLAARAFSGVLDVLRALEARRYESPSWRLSLAEGAVNIALAVAVAVCGFLMKNMKDLVYLYAAMLLYGAAVRIVSAFRKTAIVYIQ